MENHHVASGNIEGDSNDVKVAYQTSPWSKLHSSFDSNPIDFTQDNVGLAHDYRNVPTYLGIFTLFWPIDLLKEIACKSSRYVGSLDNDGRL